MPPLTTEAFRNLPTEPPEGESDLLYWLRKAVGVLGPATPAGVAASIMEQEVPSRAPSTASKIGSEGLDWMMLVGTLLPLLMGKGRGAEVFGKEMMDTSRRAYPKKWERIQSEQWRPFDEPEQPAQEALRRGRTSAQQRGWESVPPNRMPPEGTMGEREYRALRQGTGGVDPVDIVAPGGKGYMVGHHAELPGGASAHYEVVPSEGPYGGFRTELVYVTGGENPQYRRFQVGQHDSIGEATAKARQLANRLDLAAKDMRQKGWYGFPAEREYRDLRLPWEKGTHEAGTQYRVPGWWRYTTPRGPGAEGMP